MCELLNDVLILSISNWLYYPKENVVLRRNITKLYEHKLMCLKEIKESSAVQFQILYNTFCVL